MFFHNLLLNITHQISTLLFFPTGRVRKRQPKPRKDTETDVQPDGLNKT